MSTKRALTINNPDTLKRLKKEVAEEFITSNEEVYKVALRSLTVQEQKLREQIKQVEQEIGQLDLARKALDSAFLNGTLHSAADAQGVVRSVAGKS